MNLHVSVQLKMLLKASSAMFTDVALGYVDLSMFPDLGKILDRSAVSTGTVVENHVLRVDPDSDMVAVDLRAFQVVKERQLFQSS